MRENMRNHLITTPLVLSMLIIQQAHAGQPCDDIATAINTCIPGDVEEISPAQLACLRSVLAKVEREMNAAYQQRLKITAVSFRHDLVSAQKLWVQSTEANCKFFGNNTESAARYECLISAMIGRRQTLEAID
jgi:uncharacterized protein YecT (DUF1311 family)